MTDSDAARRLRHWILSERMTWTTENDLQRALDARLAAEAVKGHPIHSYAREVRVDEHNRIDFVVAIVNAVGGDNTIVAVELKVAGSAKDVHRQLERYAGLAEIDEVLLVTTKASHHRMPTRMLGKPVILCSLVEGGL